MRATDAKAKRVPDGHRRILTIHDGAVLTPALVGILATLLKHADDLAVDVKNEELESWPYPSAYQRRKAAAEARRKLRPVLMARTDGIAVYTSRRLL